MNYVISERFCMKCGTKLIVEPVWTGHYNQFEGVKTYKLLFWCVYRRRFWDGHDRYFLPSRSGRKIFTETQLIKIGFESLEDENADMGGTVQTNTASNDIQNVKDLTFYMGDKTDDELWDIVREACRKTTPTWRAFEVLHSRFNTMKRHQERGVDADLPSPSAKL